MTESQRIRERIDQTIATQTLSSISEARKILKQAKSIRKGLYQELFALEEKIPDLQQKIEEMEELRKRDLKKSKGKRIPSPRPLKKVHTQASNAGFSHPPLEPYSFEPFEPSRADNFKEFARTTSQERPEKFDFLANESENLFNEFDLFLEEKQMSAFQKKLTLPWECEAEWDKNFSPILKKFRNEPLKSIADFLEKMEELVKIHLGPNGNIAALRDFFKGFRREEDKTLFLKSLLPYISGLALESKKHFPEGLKILQQKQRAELTLNKLQTACLISNMFFCTFSTKPNGYLELPETRNFSLLFSRDSEVDRVKVQKLACIYNYFKRSLEQKDRLSELNVMYQRLRFGIEDRKIRTEKFWQSSKKPLGNIHIRGTGKIEESAQNIQVIFSNKFLGGRLLSDGCSQEQIRFCINPELIPSILFMESLEDDEAALFYGAEQFSEYRGYNASFEFKDNFQDRAPIDVYNRKDAVILAIDAKDYKDSTSKQYAVPEILRELAKAHLGFRGSCEYLLDNNGQKKQVATGLWGSGAFLGDPQLKLAIQWLAASEAERELIFFTDDKKLARRAVENFVEKSKQRTVGGLFLVIEEFLREKEKNKDKTLFNFIY